MFFMQVLQTVLKEARGRRREELANIIYKRLLEGGYLETTRTTNNGEDDVEDENNQTFSETKGEDGNNKEVVKIFLITPTYKRPEQEAELTRMGQTLMLVNNDYEHFLEIFILHQFLILKPSLFTSPLHFYWYFSSVNFIERK